MTAPGARAPRRRCGEAAPRLPLMSISPAWSAAPFAGILLSIAVAPLLAPRFWAQHYGKVGFGWALVTAVLMAVESGPFRTASELFHVLVHDYLPFIVMLFTFFTVVSGLILRGTLPGTPLANTGVLASGAMLASIVGATGASILLIRPLIAANAHRRVRRHIVIFVIFLVCNIGGALSPLGNPPLFLGYLQGVDVLWPIQKLWPATAFATIALLLLFFALDTFLARHDSPHPKTRTRDLRLGGLINIPFLAIAIGAIVISGSWAPLIQFTVFDQPIALQHVLRDLILIGVGLASLLFSDPAARAAQGFEWEPLVEVAILFAAIFVCMSPVLDMLQAGPSGPFAPMFVMVTRGDGTPNNSAFFWASGLLSGVLDNAPTYLAFFNLAGGDAARLSGPLASTLVAISLGSVFMGALTYIGNAPNFMMYTIARRAGVTMPSFFGYVLWSGAILLPVFLLVDMIFLR
jgi:Na+/H+ antiporter NhaD/arsenite permease-like protein